MRITLGYDHREYATVCGTQLVLRTWLQQKCWSQKSPLVISANTLGKGSPERPQIRDDDGIAMRSRTLVEASWGRACRTERFWNLLNPQPAASFGYRLGCVCVLEAAGQLFPS